MTKRPKPSRTSRRVTTKRPRCRRNHRPNQGKKLRQGRTTRNVCAKNTSLKALLCLLYQQKRELLETAAHLKHYYRRPLTSGTGALA
jgi:hypothetical protein